MTNKVFLLIIVLINFHGYSQRTYIPDDNFEQFLIDQGYDSGQLDNYVDTKNISSISRLGLYNINITDLTGIEGFSDLNNLSIFGTKITVLNLINNLNIDTLFIGGNRELEFVFLKNLNKKASLEFEVNKKLKCIESDDYSNFDQRDPMIGNKLPFKNDCGITYLPDPNFEQVLIDSGYDTGPLNGYVVTANVEKVNTLNISNKNVTSLVGIEDFVALTTLDCHNNLLTELDLSKNLELTYLDCSGNQLKHLNVKNGNNKALIGFNSQFNPNLKYIAVDKEEFFNKQSVKRDSNNIFTHKITYVPDKHFEMSLIDLGYDFGLPNNYVLTESINTINALDVANKGIIDLNGIEDFTSLTRLDCHNNNLIELDLSKNLELTILDCSKNQLKHLIVKNGNNKALTSFNSKDNPHLKYIQVDDQEFSEKNWNNIDAICSFTEDDYATTYVPDDNFEQFLIDQGYDSGQLDNYVDTKNISSITDLHLENNNITDLTGIEGFSDLKKLEIWNNQITHLDLSSNRALYYLSLSNSKIEYLNLNFQYALKLITLVNNSNLKCLSISNFNANKGYDFEIFKNKKLECIEVDNPEAFKYYLDFDRRNPDRVRPTIINDCGQKCD